jgi:hypothetical protein
MSERTLTRRLAEEGVTFNEILQQLKASLAIRYLEEDGTPISRITRVPLVTLAAVGLTSRPDIFGFRAD